MTLRWGDPRIVARLTSPERSGRLSSGRKGHVQPEGGVPNSHGPRSRRSAPGALIEPSVADVRSAHFAGAAGRFSQRVLSGSFLPFPLALVRQEGANTGLSRSLIPSGAEEATHRLLAPASSSSRRPIEFRSNRLVGTDSRRDDRTPRSR